MRKSGPKDWVPSSQKALRKKLKTEALDNHGYRYAVWLLFDHSEPMGWKWILRIDGTPGSWYMSTILEGGIRDKISIDYGQRWDCINFREIMQEAITLI